MNAINIALVAMAVFFIGGMIYIGRRSSAKNEKPKKIGKDRPF